MRVAIIYDAFPHYRQGVMQALLNSQENQYVIVGAKKYPTHRIATWWPDEGAETVVTPCQMIFGTWLIQRKILSLATRKDIDAFIFLGNPHFLFTWIAASLARFCRKTVLFWTHGWQRDKRGLRDWIRSAFFSIPHGLLLYGNRARQLALARGFADGSLYVIYNSLDYQAQKAVRDRTTDQNLSALRARYGIPNDRNVICCTARLTRDCRFDLLLDAASILRDRGINTHIFLIGDGPERNTLQDQAHRLALSITFLGECYDEALIGPVLMTAVATVSPGKVGLTAMHSLAYGTPVITHSDMNDQRPEVEAVVDGETGFLFQKGSVEDLAAQIETLIKLHQLPEQKLRMQRNCIDQIERRFNPDFQRIAIESALRDTHQRR